VRQEVDVIRLFVAVFLFLAWTVLSHAQCFAPVSNPTSNIKDDWKDLVQFMPVVHEEGVVRVQTIPNGFGDKINLDFYSITFRKDPTRSLSVVFRDIRRHFNSFTHDAETFYEESADTYFLPYRASPSADDLSSKRNKMVWESEDPKGAVMSFVLKSYTPALALAATTHGIRIVQEQGDVVATCATQTDFIFTTVYTLKDTYHPVSGHRGFGIRDNGDGTWTFYSKGADRETKMESGAEYFGNIALRHGAMNPEIEGSPLKENPDAVFQVGHKFWLHFFSNLEGYLDQRGMTVNYNSFIKNSQRYAYP